MLRIFTLNLNNSTIYESTLAIKFLNFMKILLVTYELFHIKIQQQDKNIEDKHIFFELLV